MITKEIIQHLEQVQRNAAEDKTTRKWSIW